MDANSIKQEIKSVSLFDVAGLNRHYEVGIDGVTNIIISCRQISSDKLISVVLVKAGGDVVSEISMDIPYVLKYKR